MPISLTCPLGAACGKGAEGAAYKTEELEFDQSKALLDMHMTHAHQGAATQPSSQPRTEKLTRPQLKVKDGLVTEEAWEYFNHQWSVHKRQANIQSNLKEYLE